MSGTAIWKRHAPALLGGLLVLVVAGGLVLFIVTMVDAPTPTAKKTVQQVTLIQPPPPPPKVEKPPEPEIKEEVKLDEPPETPDEMPDLADDNAPLGDDLGLDADGVAGMDGFGLVGRKGGRDLLASGGGNAHVWYASAVQGELLDQLSELNDIRRQRYSVEVRLWISSAGEIRRFELRGTTGDPKMDDSLKMALAGIGRLREKPPEDLPQPVRVRITSRI